MDALISHNLSVGIKLDIVLVLLVLNLRGSLNSTNDMVVFEYSRCSLLVKLNNMNDVVVCVLYVVC